MLEYRSVILQYCVPRPGEVRNYHRETLGLSVRRDEVAMHCTLISSSTLVCTLSSCCPCCDVWGASTAVILLPSDTEYASNRLCDYDSLRKRVDDRLVFLAHTYGDCRLNPHWNELEPRSLPSLEPIHLQQSIMYWPLGPSVERGFPSRLPELENAGDEEEERPLLLNLMVSNNVEKPTRMQAWLEATTYCASLPAGRCYLHSNDLISRVIRVFDSFTALSVHDFFVTTNPASTELSPCPFPPPPSLYVLLAKIPSNTAYGKRSWLVLFLSLKDPAITDSPEMHPAYGSTFRCTPVDVHRVLRKYRAPVVYVKDWRELEGVISRMGISMILEKRRELKTWFREFKVELKRELIERLRWLNAATWTDLTRLLPSAAGCSPYSTAKTLDAADCRRFIQLRVCLFRRSSRISRVASSW